MFAACNKMIYLEMTFPPGKEFFNLPVEFINQGYVFCRKIKPIGGYPIFYVINNFTDQTQRLSEASLTMKDIGKPCTGKPYALFDEGALKRKGTWDTQ